MCDLLGYEQSDIERLFPKCAVRGAPASDVTAVVHTAAGEHCQRDLINLFCEPLPAAATAATATAAAAMDQLQMSAGIESASTTGLMHKHGVDKPCGGPMRETSLLDDRWRQDGRDGRLACTAGEADIHGHIVFDDIGDACVTTSFYPQAAIRRYQGSPRRYGGACETGLFHYVQNGQSQDLTDPRCSSGGSGEGSGGDGRYVSASAVRSFTSPNLDRLSGGLCCDNGHNRDRGATTTDRQRHDSAECSFSECSLDSNVSCQSVVAGTSRRLLSFVQLDAADGRRRHRSSRRRRRRRSVDSVTGSPFGRPVGVTLLGSLMNAGGGSGRTASQDPTEYGSGESEVSEVAAASVASSGRPPGHAMPSVEDGLSSGHMSDVEADTSPAQWSVMCRQSGAVVGNSATSRVNPSMIDCEREDGISSITGLHIDDANVVQHPISRSAAPIDSDNAPLTHAATLSTSITCATTDDVLSAPNPLSSCAAAVVSVGSNNSFCVSDLRSAIGRVASERLLLQPSGASPPIATSNGGTTCGHTGASGSGLQLLMSPEKHSAAATADSAPATAASAASNAGLQHESPWWSIDAAPTTTTAVAEGYLTGVDVQRSTSPAVALLHQPNIEQQQQQQLDVRAAIHDIRLAIRRAGRRSSPPQRLPGSPLSTCSSPAAATTSLNTIDQPVWVPRRSGYQKLSTTCDDPTSLANDTDDADTDQETDRLLGRQRRLGTNPHQPLPTASAPTEGQDVNGAHTSAVAAPVDAATASAVGPVVGNVATEREARKGEKSKEEPPVLIEGVLFRARYLGSTQLVCDGQPTKLTRMSQAEEAVSRIKSPDGESQPHTDVDLFISTEKIMVLNTDLKEIMMDHALRTISYIADIGDLVVLMARRRVSVEEVSASNSSSSDPTAGAGGDAVSSVQQHQPRMICHVFESDESQFIAQSIGQAFQVAYMEFLKANGIDDHNLLKEMDYQDVLNSQEIFEEELRMFAKKELQKEVIVPKHKAEILGVVIVESGWGSLVPTVVIAQLAAGGAAARCGSLNIGDQIIAINGVSLVGLPLITCQNYVKNTRHATAVKLTVVPCAPVVEVRIRRPDTKYQLGFSVQNGVICSLLRGGIAERGGVRVGHRIIEINGHSVVAVPHERIVSLLANSVGEILMKTMPTSLFRLLTGQETPVFI